MKLVEAAAGRARKAAVDEKALSERRPTVKARDTCESIAF